MLAQLGIEAAPLPGTKADSLSPEVRTLIGDYQIMKAMTLFSQQSDGAQDLSNETIARVFQEETGQAFDPKRAR